MHVRSIKNLKIFCSCKKKKKKKIIKIRKKLIKNFCTNCLLRAYLYIIIPLHFLASLDNDRSAVETSYFTVDFYRQKF